MTAPSTPACLPKWCEEPCDEVRCPMPCGLPMKHEGDHACLPPNAETEHLYA